MKKIFTLLFLLQLYGGFAQEQAAYFLSDPSISPDGQLVVFSYEGDLWKVSVNGGVATRLTGLEGQESRARISPDGKWLAFSSNQYSSQDIFVMPLTGGEIRQLTYHQASDDMESWSWDSQKLYFSSDRYNRFSSYEINLNGGTPKRLFPHYFNNIHNVCWHPNGQEVYFNESWESKYSPNRKRYKGPYNPDIKSYNVQSQEFKVHTSYEGKDYGSLMDKEGNIYFVSDEYNDEFNLYSLVNGQKTRLTDFKTSMYNPQVSANGAKIVFEKDYQLFVYDVASKNSKKIDIQVFQNQSLNKFRDFKVGGNISSFDVSPDEKKIAFISRGVLFVSDIKGKFIRECPTNPQGRVLEVLWMKDNQTLLYSQTNENGYANLYKIAANGKGKERRISQIDQNERNINFNSERSKAVYLSGRKQIKVLDLNTLKSETIIEDELWGFYNANPYFGPDDRHIVYMAHRDFEEDIFVYDTQSKKSMNLTQSGISETNAYWSPDGKYIYFQANLTQPSYPRGQNNHIYRMALDKFDRPFKMEKFDALFKKEEKKEEDKKEEKADKENKNEKVEISILEEGIKNRIELVSSSFGTQFAPFVIQKDQKTYVLYGSNQEGGRLDIWMSIYEDFKKKENKKVAGTRDAGFGGFVKAGKNYYLLLKGAIHKLNLGGAKTDRIEIQHTFRKNLAEEFNQMYYEAWAGIEENFYNETFHGIDWAQKRDQYAQLLPQVRSRANLRKMFSDMLGELNSSHLGFYTFGQEENKFYKSQSISTGILFEEDKPYQVAGIVSDGPADKKGKDIQVGDRLIKINGKTIDPAYNREYYFNQPSIDQELSLTFLRPSAGNKEIKVMLHPSSYFSQRNNIYDEWVQKNQKIVDQKSNRKIAYVHMKNMGGGELNNFLKEMNNEAMFRDGLILDLRYNTGGNVHDDVLRFLSRQPYVQWKYREGALTNQSNYHPASKPMVLLINEQSLSDAEMTAQGFKQLGLGKIIGVGTYRWIIFTSGKGLVDGSFYRLPSWGCYTLDGQNLEKTGVEPDIKVQNTFKDRLNGEDPQLERAIQEVMNQIK